MTDLILFNSFLNSILKSKEFLDRSINNSKIMTELSVVDLFLPQIFIPRSLISLLVHHCDILCLWNLFIHLQFSLLPFLFVFVVGTFFHLYFSFGIKCMKAGLCVVLIALSAHQGSSLSESKDRVSINFFSGKNACPDRKLKMCLDINCSTGYLPIFSK